MPTNSFDTATQYIIRALGKDSTVFDGLDCHDLFDDIAQELSIEKEIVVDAYNTLTKLPPDPFTSKLQTLAESEGFQTIQKFIHAFGTWLPGICMNEECENTALVAPDETDGWCPICETQTICSGVELLFKSTQTK